MMRALTPRTRSAPPAARAKPATSGRAPGTRRRGSPLVRRTVGERLALRSPDTGAAATPADDEDVRSDLASRLDSSRGRGSRLPGEVRSFMEPRFGADFGEVRVHAGRYSEQMSRALGARAFTEGSDIYLGEGEALGNNSLTAHELTHVVQQSGGGRSGTVQAAPDETPAAPVSAE